MNANPQGHLPRGVAALRVLAAALRSAWCVVVLLAVTLGLGYWGFALVDGDLASPSDDAYQAVQLLYMNADVPDDGTPWQLDLARFLAPLVLPYAALVALFAAVGGRAGRVRVSLFGRGHLLIVGAGGRGTTLARSLRDRYDVVLFELDESNGAATSLRRSGLPVLFGDARDERSLRAAHPERASNIVLLTGDDSSNLEILATLRHLTSEQDPVPTHVAIDGIALWSELHRLPLENRNAQRRVEFVSVPDRVARLLAEKAFGGGLPPAIRRRVVLHGDGPEVARLVVHLLRAEMIGDRPEFILEGVDSDAVVSCLHASDEWVFDRADIRASDGPQHHEQITESFVCGLPEADALSAAVELRRRISGSTPIHVSVPDPGTEEALASTGADLDRFDLVPTASTVLSETLLETSLLELIARGRHEEYLRGEEKRGMTKTSPAYIPWESLSTADREANYRYADGIHRVLSDIGGRLVPVEDDTRSKPFPISPVAAEYLAVREHNRWWADKLQDGFYWGPEKVMGTKAHPSLVSWDELSDLDKDRDRDSVRVLPRLLYDSGYVIDLPHADVIDQRIADAGGMSAALAWRPGAEERHAARPTGAG